MGIRGLTGWIKWAAGQTICTPDWHAYSGKTIGVDILGQLYKIKAANACPILYMAYFISSCKKLNINPVFVFDGKPPDAKRAALKQRSETRNAGLESIKALEMNVAPYVETAAEKAALESRLKALASYTSYFSSEERDLCKQLCYAAGVVSINATGEADDVLAHLTRKGVFAAVISCDLDMLPRGVENLCVPSLWSMPGDDDGWIHYNLPAILTHVGFSYDKFVEMAVLMGSDYNVGTKCLQYKSAYWAIKYRGELLKTLEVLGVEDESPYYEAIERLKGLCETEESLMGEKQWKKMADGNPPVEKIALALFRDGPLKTLPNLLYATLYGSAND
jgi:5'-3' exonuclease